MSEETRNGPPPEGDAGTGDVLTNLPRTRPQRPSARRQAARAKRPAPDTGSSSADKGPAASAAAKAKPAAKRSARPAAKRTAPRRAPARARAETEPAGTPPQGFEAATGSVRPPTGAEVLGSAVAAAGDLAQAGVRAGGRVLRGALSLLPKP